ncbi:hypothetical protein ACFL9T_22890 [Thermodesulfobacteriota bacterium]
MQRLIYKILVSGIILSMFIGCASSKLSLELAIYKEDPFLIEIVTTEDIDRLK